MIFFLLDILFASRVRERLPCLSSSSVIGKACGGAGFENSSRKLFACSEFQLRSWAASFTRYAFKSSLDWGAPPLLGGRGGGGGMLLYVLLLWNSYQIRYITGINKYIWQFRKFFEKYDVLLIDLLSLPHFLRGDCYFSFAKRCFLSARRIKHV